jgi:hypothetical protein
MGKLFSTLRDRSSHFSLPIVITTARMLRRVTRHLGNLAPR